MSSEETKAYEQGEIIFSQGDPGGDLFLIKEGEIEIFTTFDNHEVDLAIMKPGEIFGTLTLLTKAPRMASARAHTAAVIQHVPQANIATLLKEMPKWMHIVLKDFASRLKGMNQRYAQILQKLKECQASQITLLDISAQVACCISACAELKQQLYDDIPGLLPQDILDFIEPMLCRERTDLDKIMQIFIESGMINLKVEQEKKRKYFTVENAKSIKGFGAFVKDAQRKKIKNLLSTKFKNKEIRVIAALIRYAQSKQMDLTKSCKVKFSELEKGLEKATGQVFEAQALIQAETLKLLRMEGPDELRVVVFEPRTLSHTLAHLNAYHALTNVQATESS